MTNRTPRRSIAALAALTPLLGIAAASPAAAAPPNQFTSRSSGGSAWASWTEYDFDDQLGLDGNVHTGSISVYEMPGYLEVYGKVVDWQCDPGEVPWGGGHGGEGGCDHVNYRSISRGPSTTFTATETGATLTGTLMVSSHTGTGNPTVSMTWKPVGAVREFKTTEQWSDGTTTYRSRTSGIHSWENVITGAIGPMGFADDLDDAAYGSYSAWNERSRTTIR